MIGARYRRSQAASVGFRMRPRRQCRDSFHAETDVGCATASATKRNVGTHGACRRGGGRISLVAPRRRCSFIAELSGPIRATTGSQRTTRNSTGWAGDGPPPAQPERDRRSPGGPSSGCLPSTSATSTRMRRRTATSGSLLHVVVRRDLAQRREECSPSSARSTIDTPSGARECHRSRGRAVLLSPSSGAGAARSGICRSGLCGGCCGSPRRVRPGCELLFGVVGFEEDTVGHDGVDRLVGSFDYQLRTELAVLDRDHGVADVLL